MEQFLTFADSLTFQCCLHFMCSFDLSCAQMHYIGDWPFLHMIFTLDLWMLIAAIKKHQLSLSCKECKTDIC